MKRDEILRLGTLDGKPFQIPEDAVTQGTAILARRRSGKSTVAGDLQEILSERGDPWVVLDPVAAHWGIKYLDAGGRPGKASPYKVLIIGGKRADVPLADLPGAAAAQILVDTGINAVVDLSGISISAMQTFVADFANELLRINETPRHIFLEEAHQFVPQQLVWDNQKLVRGALERVVTQGGGLGLGYTLITQRPASVAKNVLEQIDNLIVMRMHGPNDLKAVRDWFEHNVNDAERLREILGTIPAFKPGEAWICSPDWMHEVVRVQIRQRMTYHAGRTPKRGDKPVDPERIDMGKVIEQFRTAAEKRQIAVATERDLKAENKRLNAELTKARRTTTSTPAADLVEVRKSYEQEMAELRRERDDLAGRAKALRVQAGQRAREAGKARVAVEALLAQAAALEGTLAAMATDPGPPPAVVSIAPKRPKPSNGALIDAMFSGAREADMRNMRTIDGQPAAGYADPAVIEGLTPAQQRMLNVLAAFEPLGMRELQRQTVAVFSDQSTRSSSTDQNFGTLVRQGLIAPAKAGHVALTDAGRSAADEAEIPLSLAGLHNAWCNKLSEAQGRMLRVLIDAHPGDMSRVELAEATNQSTRSSSTDQNFGTLSRFGLIRNSAPGRVVATSLLFPEGLV